MRAGWNPARRNRNIGTARQGHGSNNRMVIPEPWSRTPPHWQPFRSRLASPVAVRRAIGARNQLFLVEPPRAGFFYPCSLEDMTALLAQCPPQDLQSVDFIILRQPTRKQHMLSPVWGRAVFDIQVGSVQGDAIIIEAQSLDPIQWSKGRMLSPAHREELERLRGDGHGVVTTRHGIILEPSAESLRNTVLYRTLPHEIGHHIDYRQAGDPALWHRRGSLDKENFAHRYAECLIARLRRDGVIPLPRRTEPEEVRQDGVGSGWFSPSSGATRGLSGK